MRSSQALKTLAKFLIFFAVIYQFHRLLYRSRTPERDIETFLFVCSQWNIPVVLIDRERLEYYQKSGGNQEKNKTFATEPLWTFATWGKKIVVKDGILQQLEGLRFDSVTLQDTASSRPTGIILRTHSSIIHVVLFYKRKSKFWWHGSLDLDYTLRAKLAVVGVQEGQLTAMKDEGAYDKFHTEEIQINLQDLLIPKDIKKFLEESAQSKFIECNMETANRFVQQYGKDESRNDREFVRKSRITLLRAKYILNRLEVSFWLQSGTLLGYFRECDIISYTSDVDIGFYAKDYKPGILLDFESSGFDVVFVDGRVNDSFVLSLKRNGVKLDLIAFYEEDKSIWMGHSSAIGEKFRYIYPQISLCWTEFLEMKVRVPCNIQEVIEVEYGKDWFTPKKDFNYLISSKNSVQAGKWPNDQNPHETYKSYLEVLRRQGH